MAGWLLINHLYSEDPIISYTQLSGHFTSWTKKNKKQEEGRKEQNRFKTAKYKETSAVFFWYYVCMNAFGYHKSLWNF